MSDRVVVLTGGVGGAKLVLGLTQVLPPELITAVVNTADDFCHLGLWVSPDVDTLLYTLSGQANQERGWGRQEESWTFMTALQSLGAEDWFALGDGDLALHVLRTQRRGEGRTLSSITREFAQAWGISIEILPMSDDPVTTTVLSDEGELPFQRYFVERRCAPVVRSLRFEGADVARPAPGVIDAISDPSTRAILIAPSNPYISIDPILAVQGIREALAAALAPVVAVTPIIAGEAVKGPTAKIMKDFGLEVSPATIAAHYSGLIDGLVADKRDFDRPLPVCHVFADTLMTTLDDRVRVARVALQLADACSSP